MKSRKPNDPRYALDTNRKVFIYKNLHKDCWSIKQDGLVKAHSDKDPINLYSASMYVNSKGRQRVLREKRKNVHAGIKGYLSHPDPSFESWDDIGWWEMSPITYNPYKYKSFVDKRTEKPRWFASFAKLYPNEVRVI
jgi:hypothetical protein